MNAQLAAPLHPCRSLTDDEREHMIDMLSSLYQGVDTPAMRGYLWGLIKNLIDNRSAAQVSRMEKEKGLARG